jgi:hypothetical protein
VRGSASRRERACHSCANAALERQRSQRGINCRIESARQLGRERQPPYLDLLDKSREAIALSVGVETSGDLNAACILLTRYIELRDQALVEVEERQLAAHD